MKLDLAHHCLEMVNFEAIGLAAVNSGRVHSQSGGPEILDDPGVVSFETARSELVDFGFEETLGSSGQENFDFAVPMALT